MSTGIEQLKHRTDKLATENGGGEVVLIFTDHPEEVAEQVAHERELGNIPIVLPEEDRDL